MNLWDEQSSKPTKPTKKRRRRSHKAIVAILAVLAALTPVAVWAVDDFNDVPSSNPFHDQIGWLAGTGITGGFGDGGYHPTDAVSRQAMAAFMQRNFNIFAGLSAVAGGTASSGPSNVDIWTDIGGASVQVTVPPGTRGKIHAIFTGEVLCNNGDNTVLLFIASRPTCELRILRNGSMMTPGAYSVDDSDDAGDVGDPVVDWSTGTAQAITGVLGPGTYTIKVQGMANDRDGNLDDKLLMDINEFVLRADVLLVDA